jgi:hypothetical protein
MNLLNHVEEVASGRSLDRMPLLALGFRPLYLLASVFAALSIALWALQFSGVLPQPYLNGPLWHAHEMVFGFALAVIVGFLLTAGRNWSGMPTLSGARLAALCALWVAGRVLVLTPWGWAAALTNAAFPLAAAVALAVPFVRSNNRRNYFFPALLVLLSLASVAVHMQQLGGLAPAPGFAVSIALDIVLLIMAVMAGRVIPMFTNNGVPGARASKHLLLERVSLGLLIALLAADALQVPAPAVLAVALAAFLVHAVHAAHAAGLGAAPRVRVGGGASRPAGRRRGRSGPLLHGRACTHRGRDGGSHHRHDDAHGPRSHRPPTARRRPRRDLLPVGGGSRTGARCRAAGSAGMDARRGAVVGSAVVSRVRALCRGLLARADPAAPRWTAGLRVA